MRRRTTALVTGGLLVVGYGAADAVDAFPTGWPSALTTEVPWEQPSPFPTVALQPPPAVPPVLPPPATDAPASDPEILAATLEPVITEPTTARGVGAVVVDVATGEVLLDHDAATSRVPASTIKLLTTTAALAELGDRTRLTTRVFAGADVATDATAVGVTAGTVYLVGGGDVLLAAGAGDEGAVVGRAGLGDLAARTTESLRDRGVERIRVALDDTLFAGPRTAPGWGPVDLDGGFVAPVTPLAIDRGVLPGRTARDPDPALTAARAFAAALAGAGLEVEGDVERRAAPQDARELARVESATVADLVVHTLRESDNDVAEVLARLVAVTGGATADFPGGTAAVRSALEEMGIDVSGVRMADASGLSEHDAASPLVLARLLALAAGPDRPDLLPVAAGLPVAGLQGTLAARFDGSTDPAAGVVRAKTGTLVTVVALAGLVLNADDRLLAFAVIADDVPVGGVARARLAVDEWVNRLASCGCS